MQNWLFVITLLLSAQTADQKGSPLDRTVVVTAERRAQPLLATTTLATVLDESSLSSAGPPSLDQRLQATPGFSLFRRTSSLTAHPTTQGVSLRGIGPSGAGRSLVLLDGIPLNDPFGGWIYWNRVPSLALEQVEVVRGATSHIYGSSAMGGTIQLLTLRPDRSLFRARAAGALPAGFDVEAMVATGSEDAGILVAARRFETDGFFSTAEPLRGAVDRRAHVDFSSLLARVHWKRAYLGVNLYREERGNGTEVQQNRSGLTLVEGGYRSGRWDFAAHLQSNLLESQFSRILADRSAEFLTADQRFVTFAAGSSFTFRLAERTRVGGDWRLASWDGNRQNLAGAFFEQSFPLGTRGEVVGGVRLDAYRGLRTRWSVNPRVGLNYRLAEPLTLRASTYRGFRAPTLNELYRPFRVGNVITQANPDLAEESLFGVESGLDLALSSRALLRGNLFWNRLQDPVTNATVSMEGGLIIRQRMNLSEASVRGAEGEFFYLSDGWELRLAYLYSDARQHQSSLRLPQTARHQGTFGWSLRRPLDATVQVRWVGPQFDDDQNELRLGGFVTLDLAWQRRINRHLTWFASVQNVLDRQFATALTPLERIGEGRRAEIGIRVGR